MDKSRQCFFPQTFSIEQCQVLFCTNHTGVAWLTLSSCRTVLPPSSSVLGVFPIENKEENHTKTTDFGAAFPSKPVRSKTLNVSQV